MTALLGVRGLARNGLDALDFDLEAGECLVVRGPSGAGKTLLLRALADLDPSSGDVALDGASRESMSGPDWRRHVVYVAAEPGWWSERVEDHFESWDAAAPLVARLGFTRDVRREPLRILSTGERQRLALVRALVLAPRVLLLDEPTAGLDEHATAVAEELVREQLERGSAAVWVTHDAAQARRLARRALAVESGHVREVET